MLTTECPPLAHCGHWWPSYNRSMRPLFHLIFAMLVMSCGGAPDDKIPYITEMVGTQSHQEHAIQQGLQRFAERRGLSMAQDHHVQEFGCSNIYSFQDGEIVVRNAFGFDYEISAYRSKKGDEARLASLVKELATIIRSAPKSAHELC